MSVLIVILLSVSIICDSSFRLVLNALLGWWWADPVAALIMVPIIARLGFEGLRGEVCNDCH